MKNKTYRFAVAAALLIALALVFAAPVGAAVAETDVAKIGDTGYATLKNAFDAALDGDTIKVLCDITFTIDTVSYNDGTYCDGIRYNGDKSFTVDFGEFTVTDDGCVNDYLIYINNKGDKENTITFTNGKLVSKNGCWATVCVGATSSTKKTVLNLNGMEITNSNDDNYAGNLGVRVRGTENAQNTVNVNDGTIITSDGASYGAGSNPNAILNINTGAKVMQKNSGTTSGNSVFTAVGGNGVINIYDGAVITSDKHGVHTMTTGTPVVNIYGGTITTSADDGFALWASTNGGANQLSTINVYGGTINGKLGEYNGDSRIFVSGGTFSVDVTNYLKEGYSATQSDSKYVVSAEDAVAQIGDAKYASLADAVTAAEAGDTITLLKSIDNLPATIKIEKKLTITGGESQKSITTSQRKIFEVYADATFKNLNLVNTNSDGRCIDTRKPAITVNIDNCNLIATNQNSNYTQPLTIGGSGMDASGNKAADIIVNLNKVNIEAKHYGIIIYNPVDLTITDSSITGYAALYFKGPDSSVGSSGSTVKINGESTIKGINSAPLDPNNAFGTFVFRSGDVEVIMDNADVAHAISETGTPEWIFDFCKSTGNTVTINSGVHLTATGGSDYFVRPYNDDSEDTQNTVTINSGVTSAFPIDSKYFANKELVCLGSVDGKYTVTAKTYKLTATEKVGFDSVKVGYTQPEPQTVTVTNNCNVPVKLEQPSSTNYVIGTLSATELAPQGTATFTIQPQPGLAVGNYADTITVNTNTTATADIKVSFLVYQPSSGGSSKPVEEPEEPVVKPEVPTEEPEAGEATVETEVTDGGEVVLETPTEGGAVAADDDAKITGVVLPTGTDSEVTFIPISEQAVPAGKETQTKKVFEINVPTYEKGKPATIKFTMTVAELEADGKTAGEVALWHFDEETGEWTKLVTSYTIVDGVVYFEAITYDFSPFAIIYEETPVEEPVEEPETPATPAPILAVLAGLGAAVVLRRK